MRARFLRLLSGLALLAGMFGLSVANAPAASAHPLGNFTVNFYSGILVQPRAVLVLLVVDRAEIPTLQTFPDAAIGVQPKGADAWQARQCAMLAGQANLSLSGHRQELRVESTRLQLLPGAAGLATSRLECQTRTARLPRTVGQGLTYHAAPTGGHVGWHEVTARGDGVTLAGSTVPVGSISRELTAYPLNLLASPLNLRSASLSVEAGTGIVAAEVARLPTSSPLYDLDKLTSTYTDLVSRTSLTPGFALLALLLSLILGGMHAFAPGHGKTLMAAYLVGRDGTWRQAAVIGLSVTVTHTIGVLLLGVALSAAAIAAPETVYPWLGLISGVLLAGIGVTLLRSARSGHVHGPGGHVHGPGGHTHGPGGQSTADAYEPAATSRLLVSAHRLAGPIGSDHEHGSEPHMHRGHQHGHDHEPPDHGPHDHGPHAHGPHAHGPHDHGPHDHEHGGHGHEVQVAGRPEPATALPRTPDQRRWRTTGRLAAVGLVGGMVPSPSALLVLLGGIALGRAWFGAVLVVAYGMGMATALVGTGLLLVAARDRFERWSATAERRVLPGQATALRLMRRLPLLTAVSVILVGSWIAVRSIAGI